MVQIFAAVTSFLLTFLMMPLVIQYLAKKSMVVSPGGRKIHRTAKPAFGGVPIFAGFVFSTLTWVNLHDWKMVKFMLLAQFVMFAIGFRDDLLAIKPYQKLGGQVLAALVAIFLFDIKIKSGFGLFGIYELPELASYAITIFAVIIITNSFNLIDGLDGLAGSIALIVFITFGVWFFMAGDAIFSIMACSLVGGLFAFLIFNWQPSKIFMGDTGSLFIGLTLALFTIHFMDVNSSLPETAFYKFGSTIGMSVCFVIIPMADTFRIIIVRLLRGQSPFKPDKRHVHHTIMRLGLTHSKSTLILVSVQMLFICIGLALSQLGDVYFVPVVVLLSISLIVIMDRMILNRLVK